MYELEGNYLQRVMNETVARGREPGVGGGVPSPAFTTVYATGNMHTTHGEA